MYGLFGIMLSEPIHDEISANMAALEGSLNPVGTLAVSTVEFSKSTILTSRRINAPKNPIERLSSNEWEVFVIGDIVNISEISTADIISKLHNNDFVDFNNFEGAFGIVAYNKLKNKLLLVSDRRCQYPIYWSIESNKIYFGTEPSSFCKVMPRAVNEQWLWEVLYFNFPISDITFLKDVARVPAGSVVAITFETTPRIQTCRYARSFETRDPLIQGKKALDSALEVFQQRLPMYYGDGEAACALTSGWDGRTVLAFRPPSAKVTAYTYGVPGCEDIERAATISKGAKIAHKTIPFGSDFVENLPRLMMDAVYVSSGHQGVMRATLLYAYNQLTESGTRFPVVLSGVFLDCLFRGHAATPPLVAPDVVDLFLGRSNGVNENFWRSALGDSFPDFNTHTTHKLHEIAEQFGSFNSGLHHLNYLVYLVASRYFGGEMKIANHFTTWRVPAWDSQIIELAYSIAQSTLNFSQYAGHARGAWDEMVLQSFLLEQIDPVLSSMPVGNVSPGCILQGKAFHVAYKAANKLRRIATQPAAFSPLEDWDNWLGVVHKDWLDALVFSERNRIENYVDKIFINNLKTSGNNHMTRKLLNLEIIIRLVENGWVKFW